MADLSISLLGSFQVLVHEEPAAGFESDKVRALLAYLALESDRPHRRETLAALLWPERPERVARHDLSQALSNLRRAIGDCRADPPFLAVTRQTVQFNRSSDHWLDVAAFTALLDACRQHSHRRLDLCAACMDRLHQATDLCRGDFLQGLSVGDSPPYEEWLLLQQERFHRLLVEALRSLARCCEWRGEHERALQCARRYASLEPWREDSHRQVMRGLALTGQRNLALAQYGTCRRILASELDVAPEEATTALYRAIRDGQALPPADLLPHNLPAATTPFVGRETELGDVKALLRDPACRLLTLVGPGGIGKTRLALEAASDIVRGDAMPAGPVYSFAQGIHLISLAALSAVETIVPAVAAALGLSFYSESVPGQRSPARRRSPKEQLLDYLRPKGLLLILDGFEQLLSGTSLVTDILRSAPKVKVLVTSRARLNVQGEHLYSVSGMDYPGSTPVDVLGIDQLDRYSAMRLFLSGARRVLPGYEPTTEDTASIAQICRLVQGMPLAILLAATWMETLPPAAIAAHVLEKSIDFLWADWPDVPERQRSLRAVFDRSWAMLTEREREALAGVSVFRGSFTQQAYVAITGSTLSELRALMRKSLLERTPGDRYEMHELLRQYAAEKLEGVPLAREAMRERHAAYYAAAVQKWAEELKTARQQAALEEMSVEIENARAAWEWAVEHVQVRELDHMADGLGLFYRWQVRHVEGEIAFRAAAEALTGSEPTVSMASAEALFTKARVLAWQAVCSEFAGRVGRREELLRESLATLEDPRFAGRDVRALKAFGLLEMGRLALTNDYRSARERYEQSLSLYRDAKDRWGVANALLELAVVTGALDDQETAALLLEESLVLWRELGDPRGMARVLTWLGFVAAYSGQIEAGERLLVQGIEIVRRVGDRASTALGLLHYGMTLILASKLAQAKSVVVQSLTIWKEIGSVYHSLFTQVYVLLADMLSGQYAEVCAQGRIVLCQARQRDLRREAGFALFALAGAALAKEAFAEASDLAQESVTLYQQAGQLDEMGWALAVVGYAALWLGDLPQARTYLRRSLQAGVTCRAPGPFIFALPGFALLFGSHGEPERAVELYALASRYPLVANSRWFEDVAGRHIATAAAALPADVVTAAQERGRAREMYATAQELLAELGG